MENIYRQLMAIAVKKKGIFIIPYGNLKEQFNINAFAQKRLMHELN